jgi:hypothetical protein
MKLLFDWIDFLSSRIDTRTFTFDNQDVKRLLLDKCKEVLDLILDKMTFEKFIETLRKEDRDIMRNKYIMDKTVSHFREQQSMTNSSTEIILEDSRKASKMITADLNCAIKIKLAEVNNESQSILIYKWCKHTATAVPGLKEGKLIHCHQCNNQNPNARMFNTLDKIVANKDSIPLSDTYNSTVSQADAANRPTIAAVGVQSPSVCKREGKRVQDPRSHLRHSLL